MPNPEDDEQYCTLDTSLPRPTETVKKATMDLAKLVEKEMGVKNGTTCLFWAMINTIQHQAGHRPTPTEN